jgi:hypothetical protein
MQFGCLTGTCQYLFILLIIALFHKNNSIVKPCISLGSEAQLNASESSQHCFFRQIGETFKPQCGEATAACSSPPKALTYLKGELTFKI